MKALAAFALAILATPAIAQDEASLRAADATQHAAAGANDGTALIEMAHANFRLYAPEGYIGDLARLEGRFKSAETGYTRFEREVDALALTDNVGVIMGRETVARKGGEAIARRFTNIWIWEDGRWQWLARHAQLTSKGNTE